MTTPIGGQGHLGLRIESSFASGGQPDTWQPISSESVSLTINNTYGDRIASTSEQVYGQRGNEVVSGNIAFEVSPGNTTKWWRAGVGQAATPYFSERPLDSLCIEIDRETAAVKASGCMVGNINVGSSQGGTLTCSIDIEGKGLGHTTANTPVFNTSDAPYLHSEATITLDGTNDDSVTAWSMTINNNLQADLFGTGLRRLDIPAGKQVVTGSFTKLFDDTVERNKFMNTLPVTFKVRYTRGSNALTFMVPKLRYDTHPEELGGQSNYILETFNWTAYTDTPGTQYQVMISGDN